MGCPQLLLYDEGEVVPCVRDRVFSKVPCSQVSTLSRSVPTCQPTIENAREDPLAPMDVQLTDHRPILGTRPCTRLEADAVRSRLPAMERYRVSVADIIQPCVCLVSA
jgi:hypothetical protein